MKMIEEEGETIKEIKRMMEQVIGRTCFQANKEA